jgi:hypothetical protein
VLFRSGGYIAKAMGASILTEAESYDLVKEKIKKAVHCHFEGDELPKVIKLHFVKEEIISL